MKHSPPVCSVCKTIINHPSDRFRKRTEFVRDDMMQRLGVQTMAHYCRTCAHAEIDSWPGRKSPEDQEELFV